MSWVTGQFRPWDPAWMSLNAEDAANLSTQAEADRLFTRLGYASGSVLTWPEGKPPSWRPSVSTPTELEKKVERLRHLIQKGWQDLHNMLGKEELLIQARFYQLTVEERDDIFTRAWKTARQDLDEPINQHSFADARWLRDHFQGVHSGDDPDADAMDIDGDGDVPRSWPGWLSLEKLPAEANPSPLVFLVPQINLENLREDPIFVTFLHWRGREPPHAFWRQDWVSIVFVTLSRAPTHTCMPFGIEKSFA